MLRPKGEICRFDIRGQICPSALLTALREVNDRRDALIGGQIILSFLTDNRNATVTIPQAVRNMGYDVDVAREAGHYAISVSGKQPLY